MFDDDILNKHFTEVPSSSVPPEGEVKPVYKLSDIQANIDRLIHQLGVDVHDSYKRGTVRSKNAKLTNPSQLLTIIHTMYFDELRDNIQKDNLSPEQLAASNTKIKHIQQAFTDLVFILDDVEKKLDINSVLFILYGILNELVKKQIGNNHEDR